MIRLAATGQSWRTRWDAERNRRVPHLPGGALRHLTDGTPNSATGRNLRALCGANVRPDDVPADHVGETCRKCQAAAGGAS